MMDFDYSTINQGVLETLPKASLGQGLRLQEDPGNGCYLDAPGYPTYFTQSVYTPRGNTPRRGPQTVLLGRVIEHSDHYLADDERARLFRSLYVPLPFDHPRVAAWIVDLFRHYQHCYRDVERLEYGRPGVLIYPVPHYKLKSFADDPRWSDTYRAAAKAEVEAFNQQEQERASAIAVPVNHLAVCAIRAIYPEQDPDALIVRLPQFVAAAGDRPGDWWERHATRPTPETCRPPRWFGRHRTEGWCQFCGHTTVAAQEAV